MISRRRFLSRSALATTAAIVPSTFAQMNLAQMDMTQMGMAQMDTQKKQAIDPSAHHPSAPKILVPDLDPSTLARFVDPLPIPSIAKSTEQRLAPGSAIDRIPFYHASMREITAKLHRDLPPTRLWSYGGSVPGPTFETRSGQGLLVEWANHLPAKHFLPVDHSIMGAEKSIPEVRGIVHLHGGKTPPEHDGYPEDWYVPGKSRTYYYPNQQDASLLWYHDHSMGINRLNIYAGMLGLHIIRDEAEDALQLPSGKYAIPLVIMDRNLTVKGQLSYPVSADPEKPWVPEAFGELHLINGKIFPYLDVEPRKYRFRVLNGANGRFYRLSLSDGSEIHQIGSDQGLLSAPVAMKYIQLAPGERADIIIDFTGQAGARLELASDSFQLMQFRVSAIKTDDPSQLPQTLRPIARIAESEAVLTRRLTLDESMNLVAESTGMLLNRTPWHAPVTEKPVLNTTEIWEFVNLTDDTHPIHLHMVRFQILDRRKFDGFEYLTTGNLRYTGPAMPIDANEMGWKDTVRVNSKTVTRIIVPFTGYPGRYVWHCHVLEHEDNEMMRPYDVLPAKAQGL